MVIQWVCTSIHEETVFYLKIVYTKNDLKTCLLAISKLYIRMDLDVQKVEK